MTEQPTPGSAPASPSSAPTPSDLHRWVAAVAERLDVHPDALDVDVLLDLARDVAHTVARPAVPLTTFLAGYAVARHGGDRVALDRVVAEVAGMVERWPDVSTGAGTASGRGAGDEAEWSGEGTA